MAAILAGNAAEADAAMVHRVELSVDDLTSTLDATGTEGTSWIR